MQTQRHSIRGSILVLAVCGLIGMIATTMGMRAQGICKPDCDSVGFYFTYDMTIELPSGCWVRVTYSYRYACGNFDVGIVSVEPRTPQCASMSLKDLLDQTSTALLENLWVPPLQPDSCTFVRVIKGACWHYELNACGHQIALPCDSLVCCVTGYEVCMDSSWNRTATVTVPPTEKVVCDSAGCANVCSGDSTIANPGGGSRKYSTRSSSDIGSEVGSIRPNPTGGKTTIEFRVSEPMEIGLTVHTSDGREVARLIDGHRDPGSYSVEFDASGLPGGTYFYRLHTPRGTSTGTIVVEK